MHSYTRPRKQVGCYKEEMLSEQIDEDKIINSFCEDAEYNLSSDEELVSSQSRVSNGRTRKKKNKNSVATSSQQWKVSLNNSSFVILIHVYLDFSSRCMIGITTDDPSKLSTMSWKLLLGLKKSRFKTTIRIGIRWTYGQTDRRVKYCILVAGDFKNESKSSAECLLDQRTQQTQR